MIMLNKIFIVNKNVIELNNCAKLMVSNLITYEQVGKRRELT